MVAPFSPPSTPSGPAGGVLSGTYPSPGFASDMATQAELDAAIALVLASDRAQILRTAQGLLGETYPKGAASAATATQSGFIYYMSCGLRAGDVINSVVVENTNAASGPSGIGVKVGIYTKALAKVAQSGDCSGQFTSGGEKRCPLTGPYTVPVSDGYWLAFQGVMSTMPNLWNCSGKLGGTPSGGFMGAVAFQSGQTDLPLTAALTFNNNALALWMGVAP